MLEAAIPLEETALVIVIVPMELENERAHFKVDYIFVTALHFMSDCVMDTSVGIASVNIPPLGTALFVVNVNLKVDTVLVYSVPASIVAVRNSPESNVNIEVVELDS